VVVYASRNLPLDRETAASQAGPAEAVDGACNMTNPATPPSDDPSAALVSPSGSFPVEAIRHLVVVPRTVGPLIDADAATGRTADDLDTAIDEMFGETTDEKPGPLDAVLLVGGVGVSAWAILISAQGPLLFIGLAMALLGIALPARSVARASRGRRRTATRRRAIGDGFPLDASEPTIKALCHAYDACLQAAAPAGLPHAPEAVDAAHLAMLEVGSLLGGGQPVADAEREYIQKRTKAIRRMTVALERANRARVETDMDASIHRTPADRERATAVTEAREELEATTGLGSLARLSATTTAVEHTADDDVG